MKDEIKLAAFISHPIHYLLGLFKSFKTNQVFCYFGSDFGIKEGFDITFGKTVKWYDASILGDLPHKFLKNFSHKKNVEGFFGVVNPGIILELYRNRYSAIMIHGWGYASCWLAFIGGILSGTPVFLRGENPLSQEYSRNPIKLFFKKIILGKFLFHLSSALLYIGQENKKFYEFYGVPEEKLFFCPYSVDNKYLFKLKNELKIHKYEIKKTENIPDDSINIVFVGKFVEKKRPLDLIRAFSTINNSNVNLLLVGDGPLREGLERYVTSNFISRVKFLGFRKDLELYKILSISDIFVLPSGIGETWGMVTNEAMCFGLPVIVSDIVGCSSDLVKDGENGYRFKAGEIYQLNYFLRKMIDNPNLRREFGNKSSEIIKSYSYEADIKGILAALKK